LTATLGADIAQGAGIGITTRQEILTVCAAGPGFTAVAGAAVAVIAVQAPLGHTSTTFAGITCGAGVAIIAGGVIGGKDTIAIFACLV
jgi:hypothetical protein